VESLPLNAVYSSHSPSRIITHAFAEGAKCPWVSVNDYKEGPIAIYGLARGLQEVLDKAISQQHYAIHIDRGYMKPHHYDGYYSVTKDTRQCTGEGDYGPERLDQIRPELKPMRHGKHILLLPPSRGLAPYINMDVDAWIEKYSNLPTDRPILVREKYNDRTKEGTARPLEEDLDNCHAMVTYNSKVVITGVCQGISVFTTDACCATRISQPLETIDNPDLNIDREGWLRALACNQWTLDEMRKEDTWALAMKY
jgi:hypothetical protein